MNQKKISDLMLERYRLKELSEQDRITVEDALKTDPLLRCALEELEQSDRQFLLRYPFESSGLKTRAKRSFSRIKVKITLCAAAVLLCILLPVFIFMRNDLQSSGITMSDGIPVAFATERPKGQVPAGSELIIYIKGAPEPVQHNQTVLQEGNTIQLAYIAPVGSDYYGVIFSIDGRSVVTMHYPYRRGQSSLLVSGRRTLLNEAYTLDDAPDFEIFVFVVSGEPLNVDTVLKEAQAIAEQAYTVEMIKEKSMQIFDTCEVETLTILKEERGI